VSGFRGPARRILTYTKYQSGNDRTDTYIGHTIAHELGHYAYGVFDEYANAGKDTAKSPSTPISSDNPRETIMNSQGLYQWFSTSSDYVSADDKKTAQWRIYNSSAWDTLFRDPNDDQTPVNYTVYNPRIQFAEFTGGTAPTYLTKPTNGWDSKFEIVYMGGNAAVLAIDCSIGMAQDSPSRIESATSAVEEFVDLMPFGDKVGVVQFSDTASVVVPMTDLVDQKTKNAVKAAIGAITPLGNSNYNAALNTSWGLLNTASLANTTRFAVFLSNGVCNIGGTPVVTTFQNASVPIYTVGLGADRDAATLRSMATKTQGKYFDAPFGYFLDEAYSAINRTVNKLDDLLKEQSDTLTDGTTSEVRTVISGTETVAVFTANWEHETKVEFHLERPGDPTPITSTTLPVGVSYLAGDDYALFTVSSPEAGTWTSKVTALNVGSSGRVSQEVMAESELSIDLELRGGSYPEPIDIMVTVSGPEPVLGATVVVSVTPPSGGGSISDIVLRDDGFPPDLFSDDGVYSGALAKYGTDGTYQFEVTVTNPGGTARRSTAGALEGGTDSPDETLPAFQRMEADTITVTGCGPQPSTPETAILVPTTNERVWSVIDSKGAATWFKFEATARTEYFIETGDLVSWDTTEMATVMELYRPDATSLMGLSSHYGGTNRSYLDWTAMTSGTYYIRIRHAGDGTGVFALTIGTTRPLGADTDQGGSSSSSGSGGGCGAMRGCRPSPAGMILCLVLVLLHPLVLRAISWRGKRGAKIRQDLRTNERQCPPSSSSPCHPGMGVNDSPHCRVSPSRHSQPP